MKEEKNISEVTQKLNNEEQTTNNRNLFPIYTGNIYRTKRSNE